MHLSKHEIKITDMKAFKVGNAQNLEAATGCTVTIAKEGGNPVPAGSILSIMGLGIKQGDSVVIDVQGADDETVADNLLNILVNAE